MTKHKRSITILFCFFLTAAMMFAALGSNTYFTSKTAAVTIPEGYVSTGSLSDEKIIWDYFMEKYGNEYGVAGLMGNLFAESGFKSNNLQNSFERKLGYNDASYTKAVDDKTYTNFISDSAGYGLAQWTYYSRKAALLNFVRSRNVSIGDFGAQLDFLYKELNESFRSVVNTLKTATDIRTASNKVLHDFESPADQSVSVENTRYSYSYSYYRKYAAEFNPTTTEEPTTTTEQPTDTSELAPSEIGPGEFDEHAGDVNRDGSIDSNDAALALKSDAGLIKLTAEQYKHADVSQDGDVDTMDVTLILKYDAGLIYF